MRILHTEPSRYDAATRRILEGVGQVDYVELSGEEALARALGGHPYQALFTRIGLAVGPAALDAAPSLRWIVTPTTGTDHIDVSEAQSRGVEVVSLRGEAEFLEQVHATAELSWALLLAVLRRLPAAHADVMAGRWRREPYVGEELHGKTLGVLGLGRLGRKVAGYGLAFGMRVQATDVSEQAFARGPAGVERVGFDQLLASVDILSVHVPLDPTTTRLLDARRFGQLRPGAILINTARGEVIDEEALLVALESGRLLGAGLDVLAGDGRWEEDGMPEHHPLVSYARRHPNLILTPHIGGYGRSSIELTRRFVAERFVGLVARERNEL